MINYHHVFLFLFLFVFFRYAFMHWLCWSLYNYILGASHFHPPRRRCTQQERHIPVTRLSASLLTPWLFPDKCSCPLDSTPLSSRIMANYQEAVCWKDAARNYICLQTALRSKHMLWNKLPSEMKCIQKNQNCLQSTMWLLRNAWLTWELGYFFFFTRECLLGWNGEIVDERLWTEMTCGVYIIQCTFLFIFLSLSWFSPEVWNQTWHFTRKHNNVAPHTQSKTWSCIHKRHIEEAVMKTWITLLTATRQWCFFFIFFYCLMPWICMVAWKLMWRFTSQS